EDVGGLSQFKVDERVIREDLENDFEVRFPESVPQLVEIRLDSLLVEGTRLGQLALKPPLSLIESERITAVSVVNPNKRCRIPCADLAIYSVENVIKPIQT
ncbi:MAG: hypothetical protein ABWX63_08795, partial [Paeniglutamicibacter terrestris]